MHTPTLTPAMSGTRDTEDPGISEAGAVGSMDRVEEEGARGAEAEDWEELSALGIVEVYGEAVCLC